MKTNITLSLILLAILFFGCKKKEEATQQTILKGSASIIVDETLLPIIQDQIVVFESDYDAKITAVPKSEGEAIQALMADSSQIIILSRDLTEDELKIFEQKKVVPKRTKFATDGIALIANSRSRDSVVALQDIINFMRGIKSSSIKGLVFDNPNSSTIRYISDLAGLQEVPSDGVFSYNSNKEAIQFISENEGMIGVVGLNWLYASSEREGADTLQNIKVLAVKGLNSDAYLKPTQNNLAEGTYPLARDLFIVNAQGFAGLGMGFGSFITGERGQRIILKSGLLPIRMPGRNILIRNKIEK